MSKTVLVTGGAGYIGSHTCKALSEAGFLPVTVDNLVHGHRWAVNWGPLVVADVGDYEQMVRILKEYEIAAVLHFAAYAYVGESVEDPGKYYWNNVRGTLGLLSAMREVGVSRMVFSSTCATYGEPDVDRIPENQPQRPVNPYGRSKLMIEQILRDYDRAYQLRSVSLRYFNAAGADPQGEIGELHDPETHLVPLALETAEGRRESITVFGSDYPTDDGTCVRDYIHVCDLASAHVKALQYLLAGSKSDAFNLGTGFGISVRNVIDAVAGITGKDISVVVGERRAGDPACLVAEPGRAADILRWRPVSSDLDSIIRSAWVWHQGPRMSGI